jgi:CRP-like cAMP-binding protein
MDLDERVSALQTVPLFGEVGHGDLERVARIATERHYAAGSSVVTEGEAGVAMFVITDGEADAVKGGPDGEVHLATLGPGSFFGEMSLFEGFHRANSVRARTDLQCLALTAWDVQAELRTSPSIAVQMLKTLSRRLRDADGELAQLKGAESGPID